MKTKNKTKKIEFTDVAMKIVDMNEKYKRIKRVRKVPIKSVGNSQFSTQPHTNFADEIYNGKEPQAYFVKPYKRELQKTDKFLDRAFYIGCVIVAILGIILLIVNLTR
jgi:hypothetical protein